MNEEKTLYGELVCTTRQIRNIDGEIICDPLTLLYETSVTEQQAKGFAADIRGMNPTIGIECIWTVQKAL